MIWSSVPVVQVSYTGIIKMIRYTVPGGHDAAVATYTTVLYWTIPTHTRAHRGTLWRDTNTQTRTHTRTHARPHAHARARRGTHTQTHKHKHKNIQIDNKKTWNVASNTVQYQSILLKKLDKMIHKINRPYCITTLIAICKNILNIVNIHNFCKILKQYLYCIAISIAMGAYGLVCRCNSESRVSESSCRPGGRTVESLTESEGRVMTPSPRAESWHGAIIQQ